MPSISKPYYSFFLEPGESLILYHKGIFDPKTILDLSRNLNNKLHERKSEITEKALSIFIEISQNILKYSSERSTLNNKNIGIGHVIISEHQEGLLISSGNAANNLHANDLEQRLTEINSLTYDQLRERKSHYLKEGKMHNSSSGNIGLFQMAMISRRSIKLCIEPINEHNSFVNISTFLSKKSSK